MSAPEVKKEKLRLDNTCGPSAYLSQEVWLRKQLIKGV
jgi:hypothetical protein